MSDERSRLARQASLERFYKAEAEEKARRRRSREAALEDYGDGIIASSPDGTCSPTIHQRVQTSWFTRERRFPFYVFVGGVSTPGMGIYLDWRMASHLRGSAGLAHYQGVTTADEALMVWRDHCYTHHKHTGQPHFVGEPNLRYAMRHPISITPLPPNPYLEDFDRGSPYHFRARHQSSQSTHFSTPPTSPPATPSSSPSKRHAGPLKSPSKSHAGPSTSPLKGKKKFEFGDEQEEAKFEVPPDAKHYALRGPDTSFMCSSKQRLDEVYLQCRREGKEVEFFFTDDFDKARAYLETGEASI